MGGSSNGGRYDRAVITAQSGKGLVTTVGGETVTPARWWRDPQLLVPIGAGAAYVLVLLIRLPGILSSFYWYGDFPAALRLGDAIFHAGWGHGVQLRDQAGLAPLWIVGLLASDHRERHRRHVTRRGDDGRVHLADGGDGSTGDANVERRARRRALRGRTPGGGVGDPQSTGAWVHVAAHRACAWQLVTLSRRAVDHAGVAALAVGVVAGACVVSDTLSFAAAVVPWLICACVLAVHRPERRVVLALTAGATCVAAVGIALVAHANGIVASGISAPGLSMRGIGAGLGVAASTSRSDDLGSVVSRRPAECHRGGGLRALQRAHLRGPACRLSGANDEASAPRDTYAWFWVLSSAGLIAALAATGLGIQTSPVNYQGHYLNGLWFAVAALLPLAVMGLGRRRFIADRTCRRSRTRQRCRRRSADLRPLSGPGLRRRPAADCNPRRARRLARLRWLLGVVLDRVARRSACVGVATPVVSQCLRISRPLPLPVRSSGILRFPARAGVRHRPPRLVSQ